MNKVLNIVYLSDYPLSVSFGGKEIQMFQYLEFLSKLFKSEVRVHLIDYWNLENLNDVDIIHFFGYSNWYHDLSSIIKVKFPEIKIIVSPTFFINKASTFKFLSFFFSNFFIPNYFSYKRAFLEYADLIICNSEAEKKQMNSIFKVSSSQKIQVLYNGIESNFTNFENENNKDIFLKEFNIEAGYLLSVSFMDSRKNTINLVKSYLSIESKINRKLVIIGKNRYTNKKEKDFIDKLLVENYEKIVHIDFLERNSDLLKSAYYNCHAHILPSHYETPGITSLEAAAFGKPILVGQCKPVLEYFEELALYVNPNSNSDLYNKIIEISQELDTKRIEKVKKLNVRITHNFTIEFLSNKLLNHYKSLF